jgi:hypothetical protein
MNKLFALGALVVGLAASATFADRGERYSGHSHGHRGSSFSIGFGYSSGGHYDRSYVNVGYSSGYSRYSRGYCDAPVYYAPRPVYVERPVYIERPVYVAPPVVYSAPVYATPVYAAPVYVAQPAPVCAPTVVYPARSYYYDSCGTSGGTYTTTSRYYYGR